MTVKIVVHDANVLIDLVKIDFIETAFELDAEMYTTDFVKDEIDLTQAEKLQAVIERKRLVIETFTSDEIVELYGIAKENQALSIKDCSVLLLSRRLNATLLTGDAPLRKAAEKNKLDVHGILWLFDELLAAKMITKAKASEALQSLMGINKRLPKAECEKRLHLWRDEE
jgi:predicted nucleic acid-binding protein